MSVSRRVLASVALAMGVIPMAAQEIVLQSSVVASGGVCYVRESAMNHRLSCTIGQSVVSNKAEIEGIDRHEGFWVPWPSSIVSVQEVEQHASLHAYPNPFSVSTRIEIDQDFVSDVEVALFTLAGAQVRMMRLDATPGMSQSIDVTSVDDNNVPLASGQYICAVTGRTQSGARLRAYTTVTVLK